MNTEQTPAQVRARVLGLLAQSVSPQLPREIRQALNLSTSICGNALQVLKREGAIVPTPAGWRVTDKATVPATDTPTPKRSLKPALPLEPAIPMSLDAVLDAYAAKVAADVVARIRARVDMAIAAMDFDLDIEGRIATLLHAKLEVQLETPVRDLAPAISAAHAPLPRVVVLGLIPTQEQDVMQSHGDLFDLRFIDMAQPGDIKARCASADVVVGMTKFMNHGVHESLKSAGIKYRFCNGSVSALKRELDTYLAEVTAPAQ